MWCRTVPAALRASAGRWARRGAMSGVHSHSTMRPSLQSLGRMSFRAFKAPVFSQAAVARPQHPPSIRSSISSFCVSKCSFGSQTLAASTRRSLLCASSRIVAAAAAAAAPVTEVPAAAQRVATSSSNGNGSNSSAPSFQEAIKRLQDYWAAAGCVVWLPHNTEVGAGTMNPATFLRCGLRNSHMLQLACSSLELQWRRVARRKHCKFLLFHSVASDLLGGGAFDGYGQLAL